eukprot:TRINITY_DN50725_c0_g1_i1.p1 TRINITY_DN50725_c0_g1~~TRINITY_DN50725_c0_g1_i1.p1  ORF type:complete len:548 (+),score=156.12 TRINITY_DN50725_c0_g1_i1:79-1644(+)
MAAAADATGFAVDPSTGERVPLPQSDSPLRRREPLAAGDVCVAAAAAGPLRRGDNVRLREAREGRWLCRATEDSRECEVDGGQLLPADRLGLARRVLGAYDADGDGLLCEGELGALVAALFELGSTAPTGELFRRLAEDLGCGGGGIDALGLLQLYELPEHFAFGLLDAHCASCPPLLRLADGGAALPPAVAPALRRALRELWEAAGRSELPFSSVAVAAGPAEGAAEAAASPAAAAQGVPVALRGPPRELPVTDADGDRTTLRRGDGGAVEWAAAGDGGKVLHSGAVAWDPVQGKLVGGRWRARVVAGEPVQALRAACRGGELTLQLRPPRAGGAPAAAVSALVRQGTCGLTAAVLGLPRPAAPPVTAAACDAAAAWVLLRAADGEEADVAAGSPQCGEGAAAAFRRAARHIQERASQPQADPAVHRAAVGAVLRGLQTGFDTTRPLGALRLLSAAVAEAGPQGPAAVLWRWRDVSSEEGSEAAARYGRFVGNVVGELLASGIAPATPCGEGDGSDSSSA